MKIELTKEQVDFLIKNEEKILKAKFKILDFEKRSMCLYQLMVG